MAVAGSFKQQCPSCEAMVLIKDRKLIGKKIDCTSCKYRFVVEAPKGEAEETPPAKPAAVTTKKPAAKSSDAITTKKGPAKPGGPPVKKKVGPRRPLDDDDDEGAEPKKEGRNNTMLIGIGLAVFCVALLGVGGFFLLSGPSNTNSEVKGKSEKIQTKPEGPAKVAPVADTGELPTNVLPGDTQVVFNVGMNGPVGRAAFDTPGGFSRKRIDKKLGINADKVEGILVGLNVKKHWAFAAIRTTAPVDVDNLKKALGLQPAPGGPINKREYFVTTPTPWLGNLERTALEAVPLLAEPGGPVEPRPVAVCLMNPTLLIAGDVGPVKEFLEADGTPAARTTAPAASGGKKGDEKSDRYLTIEPALKSALDQVEGKRPPLLSVAWDMKAFKDRLPEAQKALRSLSGNPVVVAGAVPIDSLANQMENITAGALAVRLNTREKKTFVSLALEGKDKDTSNFLQNTWADLAGKVANLPPLPNLPIRLEIGGQVFGPANERTAKLAISTEAVNATWVANAELTLVQSLENELRPAVVLMRAVSDLAESQSRIFELSAATQLMAEKDKGYPRGTSERKLPGNRLGRPYPPSERVGWMPQLLPYLGYEGVYQNISFDDPWKEGRNAQMGAIPIPAFLDSRYPQSKWFATVRDDQGNSVRLGATHFVGVAGVGRDAAEYPATDPRAGIFGYDRATPLDDIKDGRSKTMLLLQVPPTYQRPWIAGGGATIMGVPEKDSVKPFVCVQNEGKMGTFAVMADGSVRFIPETIPDDVFKAMATINGGEPVDLEKSIIQTELKTKPEPK